MSYDLIERFQHLFDNMRNNDLVSVEKLDVADVSKILALLKADKVHQLALDENLGACIRKAKS